MSMRPTRRDLLKTGLAGAASLAAADLLRARPAKGAPGMPPLRLQAYTSTGDPLGPRAYGSLYLTDLDRNPLRLRPTFENGAAVLPEPPDAPFTVIMQLGVEGFGRVYQVADNGGQGYAGDEGELNLNYEFAASRLASVQQAFDQGEQEDCDFSAEVGQRLGRAADALDRAKAAMDDPSDCAAACEESLRESLWGGEQVVFERARHEIANRGKRDDFLFGCNCFGYPQHGEQYASLFAELLNFATLPFYSLSLRDGAQRARAYVGLDTKLDWARRNAIAAKGHPLVWFHRAGIPQEVRSKSFEEIEALGRAGIREIVLRYAGQIDIWDVINEAHDWGNELGYSQEQLLRMTRVAAETTKEANPNAVTIVNNCTPFGEYVSRGRTYFGEVKRPMWAPIEYLHACISGGIDFDVVGVQLYYPGYDMFEISRLLDRFAQFGKPVHITELGVSTATGEDTTAHVKQPGRAYWHGEWSEAIQADWIEQFYTLCYSKPYVEAVTWWDFADKGHFWPHGGFLRRDMTPKESYGRLKALLASWGHAR
jgi:GH35 family endo-1,4-beta-xylanase